MRKKKVAFTGVFDLVNYGDHLFPEVFDREMKKRGIECEITLFSIYRCKQAFNKEKEVYSIYDLEEMHRKCNFDAVIVGGGDIIHYESFKHLMEGEYRNYPIYDLWIIPSIFSYKNGVKLIWNALGIPFDFSGAKAMLTKILVEQVDYIAVRNKQSALALIYSGISEKKVFVVPDTALVLDESYKANTEFPVNIDSGNEKYVVVHLSKLMPVEEEQDVINELDVLYNKGFQIVLLPLAYTNDDDHYLVEFSKKCNVPCITFEKKLALKEIVKVIASCEMYIGVSFHGAVTAYSFGKKAIAYNYTKNRKTKDLFEMFNRLEYYTEKSEELDKAIQYALTDSRAFDEMRSTIQLQLKKHFDCVGEELLLNNVEIKKQKLDEYKLLSGIIGQLSLERQEEAKKQVELAELLKNEQRGWKDCSEKLEQANVGWNECAALLQNEQTAHRKLYEEDLKVREELNQLRLLFQQISLEKQTIEAENQDLKDKLSRKWWKR